MSKLRHNYKRLPSRLCITKKLKMPNLGEISRFIRYSWHCKQITMYKIRKVLRIILQTGQCGKRTLTSLSLDIYSQTATLFVNSIRRGAQKAFIFMTINGKLKCVLLYVSFLAWTVCGSWYGVCIFTRRFAKLSPNQGSRQSSGWNQWNIWLYLI